MNPELESQGLPICAFCHPDAPWVTQPQSKWKKTFYVKLMVNTKTDIDQNSLYGQASILSPLVRDSQLSFHCSALYLPLISKRKTQEPQYMEVHHIKDFGVLREWEKNKFNFCSSWNRCSESKADIEELSCSGWKRLWLICSCAAQKWGEKLSKHGGGAHNSQNQLVRPRSALH